MQQSYVLQQGLIAGKILEISLMELMNRNVLSLVSRQR